MKIKPILVILVTLIIGFVLGMLTSAQIRYQKLKPVRVFFSEDRFREGFYKTIQPDEQQKAKIEIVIDKYAKIFASLQSDFRKDFETEMKAFRKEIDSNLTKDQLARMKEMDQRREEMIRQNRINRQNDSSGVRHERWREPGRFPPGDNRQRPPLTPGDTVKSPGDK